MNKKIILILFFVSALSASLQAQPLTLDTLRAMALRNNKALAMARTEMEKARYEQKAAGTNYLPKVSLMAGYMRTGDEISILGKDQKQALNSMGTNLTGQLGQMAGQIVAQHPELAPLIQAASGYLPQIGGAINGIGGRITDAFRTDTRNMTIGTVMLTQPLYMGGKIRAYDRITRYSEQIAGEQLRADQQEVVLQADQAYWQVVALANKRRLATSYRDMLRHLDSDVEKMIDAGVATKANRLSVSVKLNEAEMTLTKVEDGLTLSRMLLCQICGLPLDAAPTLADEEMDDLDVQLSDATADVETAFNNRPELCQLETAVNIYNEKANIERAAALPQLALAGGYLLTNPGLTNGFENRFRGTWSVGVTLKMPIWNWGETKYKVRAAKAEANIAAYKLEEARENIELQVTQSAFQVNEAGKKLTLSLKHLEQAEENLRTARLGFAEGVITTSDVLAAQTAWLQAHSDKIDAQIDIRLTQATLRKHLGIE